ncbi:MAG: PmoA family protein [Acidimicrobiales bacterium]
MARGPTDLEIWPYVFDGAPRPFLHPVTTPKGTVLSVDAPDDHPWHHGLWFTFKYVNGENFWEELPPFGTLRQSVAPTVEATPSGTVRRNELAWTSVDGTVVIDQQFVLTDRPVPDAHLLDVEVTLCPRIDVVLDRTPFTTWGGYGGLTLRGRPDWHDTTLRIDDGEDHEILRGERSAWCSLEGTVGADDGVAGIAFFDHPSNPRSPVTWYASTRSATYGDEGWSNFLNAALLWDEPLVHAAGQELCLRYGVVTYDGPWGHEGASRAYADWRSAQS